MINPSSELEEAQERETLEDEEQTAAECRRIQDLDRAMAILGLTPEQQSLFLRIAKSNETLDKLAKCMAPEVWQEGG